MRVVFPPWGVPAPFLRRRRAVPELVQNGAFTHAAQWVADLNGGGGSFVITGGAAVITQGAASVWAGAYQQVNLTGIGAVILSATRSAVDTGHARVGLHNAAEIPNPSGAPSAGYLQWTGTETGAKSMTLDTSALTICYLTLIDGSSATRSSSFQSVSLKPA